jgi:hypothetical protein
MRRTLTCVVIGLFFLTAPAVNAAEVDIKCMDDCQSKGNTFGECRKQCTTKPDPPPVADLEEKKPTLHMECVMPCLKQGNSVDMCKGICTY